jgi:hypothetical protein
MDDAFLLARKLFPFFVAAASTEDDDLKLYCDLFPNFEAAASTADGGFLLPQETQT